MGISDEEGYLLLYSFLFRIFYSRL